MSLSHKIRSAGIWQSLEVFFLFIFQMGYFAIMARLLEKEDYGLMAVATGIIGVGNIFITGGIGTALIQRQQINNKHINAALQVSILVGLFLFLLFFILAPAIAGFYEDNRLVSIIRVISVNFFLLAVSNVSINLIHKLFKFKNSSLITVSSLIFGYSVGVILAINGHGVWSLIIATLLTTTIKTVAYFIYAPFKISFQPHLNEAKELFNFGAGMTLLAISNFFSNKGLGLVFGKIFIPEILGIYERAAHLKTLPSQFLGNVMDKVLFPAMAEIQDEDNRLKELFKFGLGLSNSIMIPLTVFLIIFTPEIVGILMGSEWLEIINPLQIMFIVLPFSNSGRMADIIIRAKGLIYQNVKRKYIFTLIIIILSGTLGYFYGLTGAAIGISISYIINYLMMVILVKNVLKINFKEMFLKPLNTGLKLGIAISIFIIGFKSILNLWYDNHILSFISLTVILMILVLIVSRLKPQYLGIYLATTIEKLRGL